MIGTSEIAEIFSVYRKHGWTLRRVLLTDGSRAAVRSEQKDLFGEILVENSSLDAAWFSRESSVEVDAWELRRLGGTPFALIRSIPKSASQGEASQILHECEIQMSDYATHAPRDLD
ncbi:MAG: hypothetical protein ABI539_08640 [Acidobacteriota bacterium]